MTGKKVTYFNGRGRGEIIRLILLASNEKFEDQRVTFEEWAKLKPSIKYGQLPVYTNESGVQMNESIAVAKYLARKGHLYGKDEWEAYLIDRAVDTMSDLFLRGVMAKFEKDEKRKEELTKELKEKHTGNYLGNLVKYLEEGKVEFFAGSKPTMADLFLICLLDGFPEERSKYPKLDNIYKKTVDAFPAIKKYLETRPETPF